MKAIYQVVEHLQVVLSSTEDDEEEEDSVLVSVGMNQLEGNEL